MMPPAAPPLSRLRTRVPSLRVPPLRLPSPVVARFKLDWSIGRFVDSLMAGGTLQVYAECGALRAGARVRRAQQDEVLWRHRA
eukprot:6299223-Prymnesium_polylepis.1